MQAKEKNSMYQYLLVILNIKEFYCAFFVTSTYKLVILTDILKKKEKRKQTNFNEYTEIALKINKNGF